VPVPIRRSSASFLLLAVLVVLVAAQLPASAAVSPCASHAGVQAAQAAFARQQLRSADTVAGIPGRALIERALQRAERRVERALSSCADGVLSPVVTAGRINVARARLASATYTASHMPITFVELPMPKLLP
jgi:hypothetical protein